MQKVSRRVGMKNKFKILVTLSIITIFLIWCAKDVEIQKTEIRYNKTTEDLVIEANEKRQLFNRLNN